MWEEAAYLAYYLHWSLDSILDLPHPVRVRMIEEVSKINSQLTAGPDEPEPASWITTG